MSQVNSMFQNGKGALNLKTIKKLRVIIYILYIDVMETYYM